MEAAIIESVDESSYGVGEDMPLPTPDEEEEVKEHSLVQREFENGKGSYFFCTTCEKSYLNVEDYIESHEMNAEAEEAFNDFIEYDALEDVNSSQPENTTHDFKPELIKNEFEDIIETSDEKYFCYDCRRCFKELEVAEQHNCPGIVNQDENEGFDLCLSSAPDVESQFMCAFCERKFENLAILEQHQKTCSNYSKRDITSTDHSEKFVCKICFKQFASSKALNAHSRSHKGTEQDSSTKEATCHICNIVFGTNKRLKLHMRIHEEQPLRSIQQVLPEIAKREYNRLDHFFCEICNKSFDQKLLDVHKSMHQQAKKVCTLCNRHFDDVQSYKLHQQMHKSKDGDSLASVIRTGPTEAMLRNAKNGIKSIHVSTAKQTYPCQYCGHEFWRPYEKTRHEQVHTGVKNYKCEICGKLFRVPYSLTLHLRTHTDVRPFVCSTCNKRFKSRTVYTNHLLTHGNRSYFCDVCEKSFRNSVQLNAHKKSHTKPFNCMVCNRPFASLHAVKLHMKSHDKSDVPGSSQQSCNICGAVYARTVFLRAHLRNHHGIDSTALSSANEFYEESAVEENVDESEAALLISAAADAEAREKQRHKLNIHHNNVEDDLAVDPEYLTNELILDNFEETVATGF